MCSAARHGVLPLPPTSTCDASWVVAVPVHTVRCVQRASAAARSREPPSRASYHVVYVYGEPAARAAGTMRRPPGQQSGFSVRGSGSLHARARALFAAAAGPAPMPCMQKRGLLRGHGFLPPVSIVICSELSHTGSRIVESAGRGSCTRVAPPSESELSRARACVAMWGLGSGRYVQWRVISCFVHALRHSCRWPAAGEGELESAAGRAARVSGVPAPSGESQIEK